MLKSFNELRSIDISKNIEKRDNIEYLPWATCLILLYENGAEKVRFGVVKNSDGHSLFSSSVEFLGKTKSYENTNRAYETTVWVDIDNERYELTYPIINGTNIVGTDAMTQLKVHTAQQRAFVKCVAVNTGLGISLWEKEDKDLIKNIEIDKTKHDIFVIKERINELVTSRIKEFGTLELVAKELGLNNKQFETYLKMCDQLASFELKLKKIKNDKQ